jgi:cyanophycinase
MRLIKKNLILLSILLLTANNNSLIAQSSMNDSIFIGPKNGYLIMSGAYHNIYMIQKFLELAGGNDAKIVVIPTARVDEDFERYYKEILDTFSFAGAKHIKILHTRNRDIANSDTFDIAIREATGVWFTGGLPYRIADAYLGTKFHDELFKLLDRGGVIGGNSAGASIQCDFLPRGDSKDNTIMFGDHQRGFGLIKNVIIDSHILDRNWQYGMFEALEKYPGSLGIGVDTKTAIVIHRNEMEVIGQRYVAIYDGTFWSSYSGETTKLPKDTKQFYLLDKGKKYDLLKRKVIIKK